MGARLDWSNILAATGLVATVNDESELEFLLNNATLPSLFTIKAKGLKYSVIGIDGSIRSPEAQDAIDRFTGLTSDEEDFIAVFVDAEVSNGNWGTNASNYTDSLYDCFFCFGLVTEANALTDMHQVLKLTATNNGATKNSDGFSFDGINDFIDSNYDPAAIGVNYVQDDAVCGVFISTKDTVDGVYFGGRGTSTSDDIFMQSDGLGGFFHKINSSLFSSSGTSSEADDSLFLVVREDSVDGQLFKNGVQDQTEARVSTGVPTVDIFIGAFNLNGVTDNFSDATLSTFVPGAAIGFDQSGHNTNVVTLLTSLGVLP